jgi:hypothetical protein
MTNTNRQRSRQIFSTLCCVAIVGMTAVSLSIMDVGAGAGRDLRGLSGSVNTVGPVGGQRVQIQSTGLLGLIERVGLQRCSTQVRPQILSKKMFWF